MKISCRHLVHIDGLKPASCTAALQRTCQGDLADDLLQRSSQRERAESNLAYLLPEATLNEHHAGTTRVVLLLLACSH